MRQAMRLPWWLCDGRCNRRVGGELPPLPLKKPPYRRRRIWPFSVVELQLLVTAAPRVCEAVDTQAANDYAAFALQVDLQIGSG